MSRYAEIMDEENGENTLMRRIEHGKHYVF